MNELSSVALILLVSLIAGHLVKYLRVPEVTGYIIAGIVVGPSVLGWINEQNLTGLSILSEIALGLILFSIGSIFQVERFRRISGSVLRVTFADALLVATLVTLAMLALGQSWEIALLLGVISMETAAASTMMVLRELNAEGPFTETLTGVIAVNNVLCLTTFLLVTAALQMTGHMGETSGTLYELVYLLLWQIFGSAALGYLVGLLLAAWATKVAEHGETLILLIGCVLLCIGLALLLNLSTLVVSLALGATTANLSANRGRLAQVQSHTDPPFYALFFVLAGAHLNLGLLKTLGVAGAAYIVSRAIGKLLGARVGGRGTTLPLVTRRQLGYAMFSHAGLAIGLVLTLAARFPDVGEKLSTIVLAAILVYEVVGPVCTRLVILKMGESRAREVTALEVLD